MFFAVPLRPVQQKEASHESWVSTPIKQTGGDAGQQEKVP
jgi:hypothetical protein